MAALEPGSGGVTKNPLLCRLEGALLAASHVGELEDVIERHHAV